MTMKFGFGASPHFSNMCGVTLMNNQNGYVVAEVMGAQGRGELTEFPSMIRVDGSELLTFDFEEITDALGVDSTSPISRRSCRPTTGGWCTSTTRRCCSPAPRTPPSTSTSTSRRQLARNEPRTFDQPVCPGPGSTGRRAAADALHRSKENHMYRKDGEKYYIVDSHIALLGRRPVE